MKEILMFAYNPEIKNVSLIEINKRESWAKVQCDISWKNAWKNDINCDGVWFFLKYRVAQGDWKHATLKKASSNEFNFTDQTPKNFSKGSTGLGMWVPESKKGAFLYRTEGEGDVCANNVAVLWDYSKDMLEGKDINDVDIRIFGIEMVYVPKAAYYLGDPDGPDGPANCFYTYYNNGAYLISSEDSIVVDAQEGCLYCNRTKPIEQNSRDDVPFVIPASFPKGYNAFWCMKYGLSMGQYVDFLNTLNRKQQNARTQSDISSDIIENFYVISNTQAELLRNTIICPRTNNGKEKPVIFSTQTPSRACNILSWGDQCAYAAWSALRPITEMEYEKACRGIAAPIANEFAWGTTRIGRIDGFEGTDGSGNEIKSPTTGIVNCCFDGGIGPFHRGKQKQPKYPGFEGPVSSGIFARSGHQGIPKRENDGATFYGIMEMSGNLWEPCVTPGHPRGRAYTGIRGLGELDADGDAHIPNWPGKNGEGAGARGGVWVSPGAVYMCMARRQAGAHVKASPRYNGGCRLGF